MCFLFYVNKGDIMEKDLEELKELEECEEDEEVG